MDIQAMSDRIPPQSLGSHVQDSSNAMSPLVQKNLKTLLEAAHKQLPEFGTFPVLSTTFQNPDPHLYAGKINLMIEPAIDAKTEEQQRKRYFKVQVETPSGQSHASQILIGGDKNSLLKSLDEQAPIETQIADTIQSLAQRLAEEEMR
jgi:hypothetical protein